MPSKLHRRARTRKHPGRPDNLVAVPAAPTILLIYRRKLLTFYAARVGELSARRTNRLTFLSGAVLGVLVSISSVGAGAIGVTILILLYPHLPMARIVGSEIAHAVPLTLVAGLGHWMLGSVDWHIFGSLLVGSLPGIFLGSYLSGRVAELALRIILALTLAVVGSKLAFDQIQNHLATVRIVTKSVRSLAGTYRQSQWPQVLSLNCNPDATSTQPEEVDPGVRPRTLERRAKSYKRRQCRAKTIGIGVSLLFGGCD
jgi:sulfite exporter TauE/SafE